MVFIFKPIIKYYIYWVQAFFFSFEKKLPLTYRKYIIKIIIKINTNVNYIF